MQNFQKKLNNIFSRHDVQAGLSTLSAVIGLSNPVSAVIFTAFKDAASIADEIKFQKIINGLASGFNQETFINEFKAYIDLSEDHAFHVSNTLRKAFLADSPMACTLMGKILADHIENKKSFDKCDSIIIHALGSVMDDDLLKFKSMMQKYDGTQIKVTDQDTVDWCVMNRLFAQINANVVEEMLSFDPIYKPKEAAIKLMNYLDEIKQIYL